MPNAVIAHAPDGGFDVDALKRAAAAWPAMEGLELAKDVTSGQSYGWDETEWRWESLWRTRSRADARLRVRQGQGADGSERRSMIISDAEKRVTAIHEAGHALLAVLLPHADPIHKVTIIPRGMALGLTQQLPVDEKHNYSREYLNDQIAILLGGRIAEEITMDSLTTGAGNDLERATELARRMVCEWGMSDAMGPLTFGKKEEQIFLGREIAQHQDYSEDTALKIDQEVKRFVTDNYQRAHEILIDTKTRWSRSPTRCSRAKCSTPSRCKRLAAGLPLDEPRPAAARAAGRRRRRGPSAPERADADGAVAEQADPSGIARPR